MSCARLGAGSWRKRAVRSRPCWPAPELSAEPRRRPGSAGTVRGHRRRHELDAAGAVCDVGDQACPLRVDIPTAAVAADDFGRVTVEVGERLDIAFRMRCRHARYPAGLAEGAM